MSNGKRIADMSLDEMTGFLKRIGNENTDVIISDQGKEVAGYDSESGMAYFRMTVARAFITALGL